MPTFKLTANSKTYTLDTNGSFTEAARTGSWSILDNGDVEVRPAGGAPEAVPAKWRFNEKNHLVVAQGAADAFDFTANDPLLEMALAANVLQVWPNGADNFKFELPFVWSAGPKFKDDGKIKASLNGVDSILDGRADKVANRFVYVFRRTDGGPGPAGPKPIKLVFTGTWKNSDNTDPGGLDVWFEYGLHDRTLKFEFPKGLWNIDATKGTLYIDYGLGPRRQRVEIAGEFQVSATAHLSITFVHDVGGTTTTNTLTFATKFDMKGQTQPTELALTIADATAAGGVRTLNVGGKFSYQSSTVGVTIGFTYQSTSGAALPRTVDLAVVLTAKVQASGTISLTVNSAGGVTTIDLRMDEVRLADGVGMTLGLNVTIAGTQKYVSGFLGFSW
jgi:hypothetical protein